MDEREIHADVREVARSALKAAWDEHGELFNPLSNTISEGLWLRFEAHCARAIMAEREAERERCAKLVDAECERVLSKQDGKIYEVDQNLRLIAVLLPDLATAIRTPSP